MPWRGAPQLRASRWLPAMLAAAGLILAPAASSAEPPRKARPTAAKPAPKKPARARRSIAKPASEPEVPPERIRPIAQAIQAAAKGKVRKFYAGRGFWPLWATRGRIGPEAEALLGHLESARLDGLDPQRYRAQELRAAVSAARGGDPAALAAAELHLSAALASYVRDLRGKPAAKMTFLDKRLKPARPKEQAVLIGASLAKPLGPYVESMGWMSPHYVQLRKLLAAATAAGAPGETLQRLALNRDRARVLPSAYVRHIVVDSASGQLWYYEGGRQVGTMRVVVGKAESPTPMLAGMLHYAVLNPYWNVPVDLSQTLVAPEVLEGKSLASMNMQALSDWSAKPRVLDPASIDWNAVAAGKRELRLRQLPGPANSMGRVKFVFPNEKGIYLHDTPDRALLSKPARHFSNGCIRLEDAAGLGKWLLARPLPTKAATEQPVRLPSAVPVYLTYLTAVPGKDGAAAFVEDVYGRDGGKRARAVKLARTTPPTRP